MSVEVIKSEPKKVQVGGFWEFRQNNSGGSFVINDNVTVHVIIEATSATDANSRAEDVGVYFGGYGDCSCCGDRWSSAWNDDRPDYHTLEEIDEQFLNTHLQNKSWMRRDGWVSKGEAYAIVYCVNGDKIIYRKDQ